MFPPAPDYGHDAYGYAGGYDHASYVAAPMASAPAVQYAGAPAPAPTVLPASYSGGFNQTPSYWYGR